MAAPGPLAGKTIVVTRPRAQAQALAADIVAAGGAPLLFPLLDIFPVADRQALNTAIGQLPACAFAVFISPNAVDHALPAILQHGPWPSGVRPVAVGPGTVAALAAHGVHHCLAPTQQFDSEALLALPELSPARVRGRRVMIFRGDGGRELLADTLRARGAEVDCISCYQRRGPADGFAPLAAPLCRGELAALTLSSSEGLRYLHAGLADEARLALGELPVFVPHARIGALAGELGLHRVLLTGAGDAGLLAGLLAYNWPA